MIVWDIHTLTDQMRGGGRLSARQVLPYLMAAVLWASAAFIFADLTRPWDRDAYETGVDSLTTLINGVISAFGVYWCYQANGGSAGTQLAERMCALGVVLFVRFLAGSALVLMVWVYMAAPALESFDVFSVLLVALFWVRLSHYITAARSRPA